ncbi:hypothetical protein [Streptomyces sp. SID1121]|uniref:hypothetical protein n=1 Tax=Streptomyces sp. SID1121 TaxID=3425888 RepID=UPI004057A7B6
MPNDVSSLPESLLNLASSYTRHNDSLVAVSLNGASPTRDLLRQIPSTQRLAQATVDAIDALKKEPLAPTLDVEEARIRLRQLTFLTVAAADHLVDAMDIVEGARTDTYDDNADAYRDPLVDAVRQVQMARELTALAPQSAADAAEAVAAALRRQRLNPLADGPQIALSAAQHSALHAVGRGHVEIHDAAGRQHVSSHDDRLLPATLKALESKDLLQYDPPREDGKRRVHLNAAGRRTLAATYGQPRPAALRTQAAPKPSLATVPRAHTR